jgi:metal-responsive CopG/Arc/MetJ family transcriptional regulator
MHNCIAIGISLPKEMMKKIDTDRGDIPRSRYVARMLERQYTFETKRDTGSLDRRIETLQSSKPATIGGLNHGR